MLRWAMMGCSALLVTGCGYPDFECTQEQAYKVATEYVADNLEAPKSLVFPAFGADGVQITQVESCKFDVSAYVEMVDAEGAKVRRQFSAQLLGVRADQDWIRQRLKIEK